MVVAVGRLVIAMRHRHAARSYDEEFSFHPYSSLGDGSVFLPENNNGRIVDVTIDNGQTGGNWNMFERLDD